MNISYFRSSSYNAYELCPTQYFLTYVLGWENTAGPAALKGTIFHRVMEVLAQAKLAEQNGDKQIDDEIAGTMDVAKLRQQSFVDYAYDKCFEHYKNQEGQSFQNKEKKEVHKWIGKFLEDEYYDPRELTIVYPEQKFDIEIKKDWAKISPDKYLSVKGSIDLIASNDGIYEIIDYKTGAARRNWATGQPKTVDDFNDDFQLRLYHYAVRHLYPEITNVLTTVYYARAGGPVTVAFDDSNFEVTESKIHSQFVRIKNCTHPSRKQNGKHWFCNRVCYFGKNCRDDKTQCQFITDNLRYQGITDTTKDYTAEGFQIDHYEAPG